MTFVNWSSCATDGHGNGKFNSFHLATKWKLKSKSEIAK
jgi:hypothetical protein